MRRVDSFSKSWLRVGRILDFLLSEMAGNIPRRPLTPAKQEDQKEPQQKPLKVS
jgi:hypothetical protein